MERRQDLLIDQMREKRKSRTNSGSGASAPGRIELAFTVMATMSVEQAWGWGKYSKVGFGGLLHTCVEAMGIRAEDIDGGAVPTWTVFAVVELDEVTWRRVKMV